MAVDPIRGTGGLQAEAAGRRTSELFEEHGRMIYGLCRTLLRDPDDADDATQATFISAYRSLLGGNVVREPAAWLATIARNECGSRAQARMREPLPLYDTEIATVAGPEDELERKALVGELQLAIAALPEKQREAVVLRDFYGLPYNEVGAALGMSVAAVESLLFRARRSLRVSLKPAAGGALVVPLAVREGIAQALPAFSASGAGAGGAVTGGVGLGLLAKLTGGSLAVKVATGVVALTAAGSMVAIESEHASRPEHRGSGGASSTVGTPPTGGVVPAALVLTPTAKDDSRGKGGGSGADGASGDETSGDGSSDRGSGDTDHGSSSGSGRGDAESSSSGAAAEGDDHGSKGIDNDSGDSGGSSGSSHDDGGSSGSGSDTGLEGTGRERSEASAEHSGSGSDDAVEASDSGSGSGGGTGDSGSGGDSDSSGSGSSGGSGSDGSGDSGGSGSDGSSGGSGSSGGGGSGSSGDKPETPDSPEDPAH